MPSAYCPSCGATYDSPRISPNGPFCRLCLARGEVVQLLPAARRRFRHARTPARGACRSRRVPARVRHAPAAVTVERRFIVVPRAGRWYRCTMPTAPKAFDAHAGEYDALRRRLIPVFDAFYGAAIEALSLTAQPVRRVLDVGAGTGLLSELVHRALPGVDLTLLDGSPAMLAAARARVGAGATYLEQDFADELPAGPWDAVVSALAIHHFEDAGKRALFAQIHERLAPGSVFVNAEHVAGPTPQLDAHYVAWHRARCAELGTTAAEWAAAEARMSFDHLATVEDQLRWLRDAGFGEVDCLFKHHCFAVIVALKGD